MKKIKKLAWLFALVMVVACGEDGNDFVPTNPGGTGTAGSFASFVIVGDHLYAINGDALKTFTLLDNGQLSFQSELSLNATLETLFPYEGMLIVGSQEGVFFLDIDTPENPTFISVYRHLTACDPVVASGTIAFSTLRATRCRFGGTEQIDAIDFSDIENPVIIESYASSEALGLAVKDNFLFVCENGGLKMYDATDPSRLFYLGELFIDGATPLDVIPRDNYLIVTTNRGIYNVSFNNLGVMQIIGQVTGG